MKLSIVIFVLATIIYGCQCAPNPGWLDDLKHDMDNMHQELEADRQQRAENLKKLHEQLEAESQQRAENLNQLHKQLEADRQQRKENRKQFHEQLEAARQQREQTRAETPQNPNGMNTNTVSGHSTISSFSSVNGNRVDKTIVQNVIDNVKYRTETEYTSATGKTEIKKYECSPPSSPCILKTTEIKDGPPENFY